MYEQKLENVVTFEISSDPENCRFHVLIQLLFDDITVMNDRQMRQQKYRVDSDDPSLLTKQTSRLIPELID